ncbi:RNA-binding protein 10-like [Strongylocentrotus purpuratus]|uniref:RNA-binding protein 5 n=1 Tax=Strongylocentrotus purpuratus TaxID=7668 RepID=A0A7M7MYP9_STRPU|nr:RNA-binding protein 10-like [Strongylocentrotus purpuratus]
MEENQGILVIGDGRASLTYSKSRGDEDWFCSQCGTQNFKRRGNCFKCGIEKNESERYSQISTRPTRILLLMGLDSLTTEEKVQQELHDITAVDMNVQLIRDPTTNTSRGLCYAALSAVEYASHLLEILNNMHPPFVIDGKQISVHFCREGTDEDYSSWAEAEAGPSYEQYYQQQAEAVATGTVAYDQSYAAAYAAGSAAHSSKELSVADKVALAQEQVQAARKMQLEQQQITQKLLNKIRASGPEKKPKRVKVDLPPPGTDGHTLDLSQIVHEVKPQKRKKEQQQDTETNAQTLQHQTSSSSDGGYYPDVSQYQYDESSGFYYDPQTGLYYDSNSQYYYNAHTQQYMYWDGTQYVPAQQDGPTTIPQVGMPGMEGGKEDKNKKEKGKVAKKVASDMRRWAATINETKNSKSKKSGSDYKKDNSSASADAGFAVLSKKADPVETKQSVMLALKRSSTSDDQRNKAASITNILAQYGGDSDSEPEEEAPPPSKKPAPSYSSSSADSKESVPTSLTDWTKLICLLCKRQFPSKEVLVKHQQFSDLHKQNLEALKTRTGLQQQQSPGGSKGGGNYRDRAQERRTRFT